MVCLGPRARGNSVRPRRLSDVVVRPLNFTVRFRMHWAPAFLLTVLAALGSGSVRGQTNNAVLIRMASDDTCLVADLPVSCREVGAKLRALGIPPDADIQFGIDGYRTYEAIRTMMDSLRQAGYKVDKVGFITKPQT